jgi:pimeloyl-ACP methyl ester carboxylesterase
MPAQWNHLSVKANGVQLHLVRQGAGAPILMLHGWPGFWYDWARNIPSLEDTFDCIALDLRGFGYSEKPRLPPEFGYNDGAMAADILELLNELGLPKVGLIGHNLGALFAQRFVRSHPQRVGKLALLNPPYLGIGQRWREPQHGPNFWYQYFHNLDWSHKIVGATPETIEIYITSFLRDRPFLKTAFSETDLKHYVEAYSEPGAIESGFKVFQAAFRGGNQIVLPEEKIITHETLVLWGEEDQCVPIRWADRLGEFFSNVNFIRVPQCGHYTMREYPELVNKHLRAFFLS